MASSVVPSMKNREFRLMLSTFRCGITASWTSANQGRNHPVAVEFYISRYSSGQLKPQANIDLISRKNLLANLRGIMGSNRRVLPVLQKEPSANERRLAQLEERVRRLAMTKRILRCYTCNQEVHIDMNCLSRYAHRSGPPQYMNSNSRYVARFNRCAIEERANDTDVDILVDSGA
ncbi:hypothetical protein RF11_10319 [Thelohanellus kitauei]|uniref:Uncharacterized protein n=1 Tax=Thelohanellus kitauei TaxID=669202 RepID=A0A0C2IK66_THEKT|nr:hypothetical protein RF11_10319 [Thelohanellus kitauei]